MTDLTERPFAPDLTPRQAVDGLLDQYAAFADLIGGLSREELDAPTRCAAWAVRDVAAHVLGGAADTVALTIGTRSPDEQAAALRDTPDLAAALREAVAGLKPLLAGAEAAWEQPIPAVRRTLGDGVRVLWYDTYVHDDDVRVATGRPSDRGPGLTASVAWMDGELRSRGWGPAVLDLPGFGQRRYGDPAPGVTPVRADPLEFLLTAAGRRDPALLGLDEKVNIHRAAR
ncbi:maleylpyruvate isomerase family mycothiol-dependent enzyme [Spongiactinospora sp. TRM90649]|uniref:maleylpyruvate isomerase family mycothiol-dependent enzyme n=1 Tax=Spongiactinospora sp. TRM90649 TaxID=3031114 RepID=UPI0023F7BB2C|nr:maleylpyruvate isomerase family mycothiol-dependent enzyme [Spongiactinospora sp. TRM90649]MDF5755629.1 maleylpyruvate isomerase family mycothiol-dependent enzyme [Spongiactinospora sp. TRM90649]